MPAKSALTVSLTPELEKFITGQVASGHYKSASEVVRDGLRMLLNSQSQHPQPRAGKPAAETNGGGHGK